MVRVMTPTTRFASTAFLLLVIAGVPGVEQVSRFLDASDSKEPSATALVKEREPATRRTLLAYYLNVESSDQQERMVKTIAAYQQKDGLPACAQVIALCDRGTAVVSLLSKVKQMRPLAAEVLATRAVMEAMARRRAAVAAQFPVPAGATKAKPIAFRALPKIDADLTSLLSDSDCATTALIAAAYDGSPDLLTAATMSPAKGDVADACRLLLRARAGQPLDAALVERIANAKPTREQVAVRDVYPSLAFGDVHVPAQCVLLDALIRAADPTFSSVVATLIAHEDIRVQMDACRAARVLHGPQTAPALIAALPGCAWPVLVECAYSLGELTPTSAVTPLIERLKKEKGRFREDLIHALSSIAGGQEGRADAPAWETWWKGAKDGFMPNPEATKQFRTTTPVQKVFLPGFSHFYSINLRSDRFSFVLDTSGSMKENAKIDNLRLHAEQAIRGITAPVGFNVIDFGGDVSMLFGYGDLGTDLKAAVARVRKMELTTHGTRTLDSVQTGLALKLDTLYFLSDGAPHGGQTDDWNGIWHAVALATRHRPVAIHTICFHAGAAQAAAMARLAYENVGTSEEQ